MGKKKSPKINVKKKIKQMTEYMKRMCQLVAVIQSIYTTRQKSNILHLKRLIQAKMLKKSFIICCSLAW